MARSSPSGSKREPHNDIDAHFQRHDRFLVIDCVCKKEKVAAHGQSCELPIKRCGFVGMPPAVPLSENVISREEAIKLWNELDAMGTMVVEGFYGFTMGAEAPQFVGGCHCCGCCCSILNAARLAPLDETIQRSNYRVVKNTTTAHSCGECVRRCQFFAHTFDKATDTPAGLPPGQVRRLWRLRHGMPDEVRSTWSPYRKRSGSTFRPASRNGKSGAWRTWQAKK